MLAVLRFSVTPHPYDPHNFVAFHAMFSDSCILEQALIMVTRIDDCTLNGGKDFFNKMHCIL